MKATKISRLVTLLLVAVLGACAAFGVAAGAEEAVPTAEIDTANVAYNEMVQLAFTVDSANLPEGAELGVMFWNADATEFTVENAAYSTFTANEKDGKTYYKSQGIPAPEMDTPIYVAAVYKVGNAVTIAETPFKYSALQYAGTRLTETTVSAKQAALYADLITYGISSDEVLEGDVDYAFVKAINGTIGSAGAEIGGWFGKEVLLRAEAKNAAGEYFVKWVDAEGETISENRLAFVTATEAGVAEYTAIFGDKADSAYATTYNFEGMPAKQYSKLPGGYLNDNAYHNYYVTESLNGDKQMFVDRVSTGSGYNVKNNLPTEGQVLSFEFDIEYVEALANGGTLNNVNFTLKDADGTTAVFRTNFTYDATKKNVFFYIENGNNTTEGKVGQSLPGSHPVQLDGKTSYVDVAEGSTLTLRWELDLSSIRAFEVVVDGVTYTSYTADVLLYANGKLIGRTDLLMANQVISGSYYYKQATTIGEDGKPSFLLDENVTMTGEFGITSLNGAKTDVAIDNMTYFFAE